MDTDKVLLTRIKRNDQKALEILFGKYYNQLCDFAFQYVHSFDLTEEVVTDVFLKVWEKRDTVTASGNFKAYLYTVTHNQALDLLKKENRPLDELPPEVKSAQSQPDEELLFQEFQNHIEALINTLPPRRKIIFKMSRLEGFTYQEIADILSISIHTVQNQMVKAVKQLSSQAIMDEE